MFNRNRGFKVPPRAVLVLSATDSSLSDRSFTMDLTPSFLPERARIGR
jgi:hypothetical protein